MLGTQVIIHNITPDQIAAMLRDIIHSEVRDQLAPLIKREGDSSQLPDYATRKETAEFLGITYATLNNWSKDTDDRDAILIPLHIGKRVFYRRDDVLAAMKEERRFKTNESSSGK